MARDSIRRVPPIWKIFAVGRVVMQAKIYLRYAGVRQFNSRINEVGNGQKLDCKNWMIWWKPRDVEWIRSKLSNEEICYSDSHFFNIIGQILLCFYNDSEQHVINAFLHKCKADNFFGQTAVFDSTSTTI